MKDSVALVKHKGDVKQTLEEGIDLLGGFGALRSPFIIKPNLCVSVDKTGFASTDVKLVEALIDLVLDEDRNLSIKVVESDSESKFADEAFGNFGYGRLEKKMRKRGFDVSLVNLTLRPLFRFIWMGFTSRTSSFPKCSLNPTTSCPWLWQKLTV